MTSTEVMVNDMQSQAFLRLGVQVIIVPRVFLIVDSATS
jgi:hypothetical protein